MLTKAVKEITECISSAEKPIVVAIDGRCASGKTTLAKMLSEQLDCNVFHMDDFFLRPGQRTAERFSQVGGNIDYERFENEVLMPLKKEKNFSYRPFDCGTMSLSQPVDVIFKPVTIIEGSYSCHPALEKYYDLKIFVTTSPEMQLKRLEKRNPALVGRFCDEWIPMEERYFSELGIAEKCHIKICT